MMSCDYNIHRDEAKQTKRSKKKKDIKRSMTASSFLSVAYISSTVLYRRLQGCVIVRSLLLHRLHGDGLSTSCQTPPSQRYLTMICKSFLPLDYGAGHSDSSSLKTPRLQSISSLPAEPQPRALVILRQKGVRESLSPPNSQPRARANL